jgi:hypothetical protein
METQTELKKELEFEERCLSIQAKLDEKKSGLTFEIIYNIETDFDVYEDIEESEYEDYEIDEIYEIAYSNNEEIVTEKYYSFRLFSDDFCEEYGTLDDIEEYIDSL